MAFKVSASKLGHLITCPQEYYYIHEAKIKVPQWVLKVFGRAMHRTIQFFYRPNEKVRKARIEFEERGMTQLFPRNEKGAQGIWYLVWGQALKEKKADPGIFSNPCKIRFDGKTEKEIGKQKNKLWNVGASMARKYWRDNYDVPFPETPIPGEKAVEMRFKVPAPHRDDVLITGVIDQIRKINGKYLIMDLKTAWWDFGEENVRIQYAVHHDYQFTIYSYAFRELYPGIEEAGIIRYPLGYKKTIIDPETKEKKRIDKKAIITTRTDRDYEDLAKLIDFYVNYLETRHFPRFVFPKFYGFACRNCDYLQICSSSESYITKPVEVSKIQWGEIDRQELIRKLSPRAEELTFSLPRLKFGKRK